MTGTVSELRRYGRYGAPGGLWPPGTYLTDGSRLTYVLGVIGEVLQLEDASTEGLENWPVAEAVARFRKVTPRSAADHVAQG
jgi:hypothetical protein